MTQLKKTKEPVHLRRKRLANGNVSLYLDIYINGVRNYEFLKLYLIPEKTKKDRETNAETLRLAEAVKALRVVDIQAGRYGFRNRNRKDVTLLDFYAKCREEKRTEDSVKNYQNWKAAEIFVRQHFSENLKIADVSEEDCIGFRDFLDREAVTQREREENRHRLSKNSRNNYFCKFKACMKEAVKKGLIASDPSAYVSAAGIDITERSYLTQEEVRILAKTPCRYESIKRMFLFSCLTGLRWSDIEKLRWAEVSVMDGQTRVTFTQKKTKQLEYLDINAQAASLMGERGRTSDKVFRKDIAFSTYFNSELKKWVRSAGIDKDISFHCARHTFAVMMIDLGADIYTVQKLLGHAELRTTEIYARILDRRKQDAVNRIPDLL